MSVQVTILLLTCSQVQISTSTQYVQVLKPPASHMAPITVARRGTQELCELQMRCWCPMTLRPTEREKLLVPWQCRKLEKTIWIIFLIWHIKIANVVTSEASLWPIWTVKLMEEPTIFSKIFKNRTLWWFRAFVIHTMASTTILLRCQRVIMIKSATLGSILTLI